MDSSGKRLGIALTAVVVALALNTVAVVSGIADHPYGRLFGSESSTRVADANAEASGPVLMVEAAECASPYPKPVLGACRIWD